MAQQDSGNSLTIEPSGFTPLDPQVPHEKKPPRPRRLALFGTMALFALIMGFLLTARSLQVVVDTASPAEVEVSGLALPFGERYLLRPGEYDIRVTAEGYHPLVTRVSVDEADSQTVELAPRALPGRVSVTTIPPGASVTLDGELLGVTPLSELAIEAGEHQLVLQEPRHLVVERNLDVTGRNVREELTVELAPAWAVVTVDRLPAGATLLVDGENAGMTPDSLEILQGERQLMLQMPAWAVWQQTFELSAGDVRDLGRIKLQPAPGLLALDSTPDGANVTLDGEFRGQTPLTLEVTPGRPQRLAVFKPGYRRYNGSVELSAAEQSERTVELEAELGRVEFRIYPPDAVLRLNGRPIGQGSQTLSLPAVEHRVNVSKSGYATVTVSYTHLTLPTTSP